MDSMAINLKIAGTIHYRSIYGTVFDFHSLSGFSRISFWNESYFKS